MNSHNLSELIAGAAKQLFSVTLVAEVSRPETQFGDFASNVALQLGQQLGQNPRAIAEQLAEKLRAHPEIASVEVAGPGFINLRLSDGALLTQLAGVLAGETSFGGKTVVLEYSDPNPFK